VTPPQEHVEALSGSGDVVHLLSFDVEEYFQVEAAARSGVRREDWQGFATRLGPSVDRVLQALAEHQASATFFVLGWVAQHEPDVVRRIADAGHEIASHGMEHRMLQRLAPDEFRQDLLDSRRVLEDLSGGPVIGYRAPTFSITHETAWALDVIAETGYRYDSSVFPIHHDRYGVPDAPRGIHRAIGPAGGGLLEIPPLTLRFAGTNWPVGGGGYLRLLPVRVLGRALKKAARQGRHGMIYLHPWELDPGQPVLPMPRLTRFRHRIGLRRTEGKLRWLLRRFRFTSIGRRLDSLLAQADGAYHYGRP
jgi:polysaccharide deacetylase family protein (PEP-CTERM system associated)